jgi:hypothetical protein
VCHRHATDEQRAAATTEIDRPIDIANADPANPFPDVTITPQLLGCEIGLGWVAKIHGTHAKYDYARTFLSRSGPPWGWKLPDNGLYECREIGPYGRFSCFFVVKGVFRRRVELVPKEIAAKLARRMGPKRS